MSEYKGIKATSVIVDDMGPFSVPQAEDLVIEVEGLSQEFVVTGMHDMGSVVFVDVPATVYHVIYREADAHFMKGGRPVRFVPSHIDQKAAAFRKYKTAVIEDAPRRRGVLKPQAPLIAQLEELAKANEVQAELERRTVRRMDLKAIDYQSNDDPGLKIDERTKEIVRSLCDTPAEREILDKMVGPSEEPQVLPLPPVRTPQPFVPWTEHYMRALLLSYVRDNMSEAGLKLIRTRDSKDPSLREKAEHELSHWQGVLKFVQEKLK